MTVYKKISNPNIHLNALSFSHWQTTLLKTSVSPTDLYNDLSKKFSDEKIEGLITGTVSLKEYGILSHRRTYLRVSYHDSVVDICTANIGNNFFLSSWSGVGGMGLFTSLLCCIPRFQDYYLEKLATRTYYQYDSMMAFHEIVHRILLETVDALIEEKGAKPLSDGERKPIMRNILSKFQPQHEVWANKWNREQNK